MCGISLHFIKNFIHILAYQLSHVFSLSLQSGFVPVQLKIAKVIPIFKSGEPQSVDNYCPISLLYNFSQILEKIVSSRLTHFLESNNLFSKFQFVFRKAHSTLHPLVHFLKKITENLNNKKHTFAIFCDLRKAFDTVDDSILFQKLSKLGIKEGLSWIGSKATWMIDNSLLWSMGWWVIYLISC